MIRQISVVINGLQAKGRRPWSDVSDLYTDDTTEEIDNSNDARGSKIWKDKAKAVDKYSMVLFPAFFFIIMGVYCVIYILG